MPSRSGSSRSVTTTSGRHVRNISLARTRRSGRAHLGARGLEQDPQPLEHRGLVVDGQEPGAAGRWTLE